jgi:4-amino-4-deoxychorismate lyase
MAAWFSAKWYSRVAFSMPVAMLVDGVSSDLISVNNRGLAYGDGLFETIKVSQGKAEFLDLHLQRLQRGCQRLNIPCQLDVITADIRQLLSHFDEPLAVLKIVVTRGQAGRGYKADPSAGSNRIVSLGALVADYSQWQRLGVKLRLCDTALSINPQLAGIKHLARLENIMARSEWNSPEIAEGIMLDSCGRVVEGTSSNIFLLRSNTLYTPSLRRCGVEGIIRQLIIEKLAPQLQLNCVCGDLLLSDIYQADEMFICNSLMGICPVIALGCHRKPSIALTGALQRALSAEVMR